MVAIFALSVLNLAFADDEPYINQTFEDAFTIEVPLEKSLALACLNCSLGSVHEYYDNNSEGIFKWKHNFILKNARITSTSASWACSYVINF